jgi:hypothetical protein
MPFREIGFVLWFLTSKPVVTDRRCLDNLAFDDQEHPRTRHVMMLHQWIRDRPIVANAGRKPHRVVSFVRAIARRARRYNLRDPPTLYDLEKARASTQKIVDVRKKVWTNFRLGGAMLWKGDQLTRAF